MGWRSIEARENEKEKIEEARASRERAKMIYSSFYKLNEKLFIKLDKVNN